MSLKEQLLSILEHSAKTMQAFAASLPEEERAAVGTYEKWCAKDQLAHIAHWQEYRAARLAALARDEEPPPSVANLEQANAECFERYCNRPWEDVLAYAEQALSQLVDAVRALDNEALASPGPDTGTQSLWQNAVGTGYTHPMMHLADYETQHGRPHESGQLWQEWASLVAPLDDSPHWQGLVRYNAACGLALSGNPDQALDELRQALELRPSLTTWSRHDPDLAALHSMPAYREVFAPPYWWRPIEANPLAEALADQFLRALGMFRRAVKAFPADEWRKGDTPYQRPAGLATHIADSLHGYSALKAGEYDDGLGVDWEERDSTKLPSQEQLLQYMEQVEENLAGFLANADLTATEALYRWTGATMLSRAIYNLRHLQHHLADMCMELHCRGLQAPDWQ
jgi:hypothetical protein